MTRKAGDPICPTANVRYLYQPGELEGGKKRATDPIWSVDIHKIDYNIVTQGIRVYYLNAPAPRRGFVKEELLIVPADTNTRMYMSLYHRGLYIVWCPAETVLFCLLLVHIFCDAQSEACSFGVCMFVC